MHTHGRCGSAGLEDAGAGLGLDADADLVVKGCETRLSDSHSTARDPSDPGSWTANELAVLQLRLSLYDS